jgi:hypothetical protein
LRIDGIIDGFSKIGCDLFRFSKIGCDLFRCYLFSDVPLIIGCHLFSDVPLIIGCHLFRVPLILLRGPRPSSSSSRG